MTIRPDDMQPTLEAALEHAMRFIEGLETRRIPASADAAELLAKLGGELPEEGVASRQVLEELALGAERGLMNTGGGRFYGWAIGGVLPAALGADWLTSAWDQNSAIYGTSPSLALLEEITGAWLVDLLGLPSHASFAFVTGCQAAHVTALAAARHKLLHDRGHDVGTDGLHGAPRIRIHTGELCHESIARAARLLGLGTGCVQEHPCGDDGRLDLDAVERAAGDEPAILVLQAGEFNTGAFDDYHRAVGIARERGWWVHVDGALGLWAAASPEYRHLMDGCNGADSWATDGHKWLNLPFDIGFVFTAHPDCHRDAMTVRASYFSASDERRQQIDWAPEWSRRGRAVPTYAALRSLGRAGLAELVERSCGHARRLIEGMGALEGVEVVAEPVINQGIVRFVSPDGDHDRRTDEVVERIQQDGTVWFGASTFRGRRVMRVPVLSWRTTDRDIQRAIEVVEQALKVD